MGGPVGPHWTLLHSLPDVHAEQLSDGLFMGGALTEVQRDVAAGRASTSDVLFYSGYAAWPIDRCSHEIRPAPPSRGATARRGGVRVRTP